MIYENVLLVSKKTGEVIGDYSSDVLFVQTKDQREQARKYAVAGEVKFTPEDKYEHMGNFVWNIHDGNSVLYPEISLANLIRLMYLATFLCYDGYLKDGKINIRKDMLTSYLSISRRGYYRFWNEMSSAGIMYESEDKIYLNDEMFIKGAMNKSKIKAFASQGKYVTRVYIESLRSLYSSYMGQSVKMLGCLFRIMPYVNREYNICCLNPLESEIENIRPMSLSDFTEILGYEKSNSSRLTRALYESVFQMGETQESAMTYISKNNLPMNRHGVVINPHLYYAGSDWSKVEAFCAF